MLEEESVEALNSLGLTIIQTKVFLALAKSGAESIHGIAEFSKVARQDIYRVVSDLEDLSLVQKIVTKPVKYRAVTIEEAVTVLLRRKKEAFSGLERKSQSFLHRLEGTMLESAVEMNSYQFFVVKGKDALLKNVSDNFNKSSETVDIATTQERFLQALTHLGSLYKKKLEDGVVCRVITEKPLDRAAFFSGVGLILRDRGLLLKYAKNPLKANVVIFDGKVALSAMHTGEAWLKSPVILTNNPAFLTMFQEYFNKTWRSGKYYDELKTISNQNENGSTKQQVSNQHFPLTS